MSTARHASKPAARHLEATICDATSWWALGVLVLCVAAVTL